MDTEKLEQFKETIDKKEVYVEQKGFSFATFLKVLAGLFYVGDAAYLFIAIAAKADRPFSASKVDYFSTIITAVIATILLSFSILVDLIADIRMHVLKKLN